MIFLIVGHTGTGVVYRDHNLLNLVAERDSGGSSGVFLRIAQQVVDDLHQAPLVGPDPGPSGDQVADNGNLYLAGGRHRILHKLKQVEYVQIELRGTHIESGDFQQVLHQVLEAVDVLSQQI